MELKIVLERKRKLKTKIRNNSLGSKSKEFFSYKFHFKSILAYDILFSLKKKSNP